MLTAERLRELLDYDPETGAFRWKMSNNNIKIGTIAGTSNCDGYVQISIFRKFYLAHRLAWLYMNSEWPPHEIDHRNSKRNDNRWINLRSATRAQNAVHITSKVRALPLGVYQEKKTGRFYVQLRLPGKCLCLGTFGSPEEASAARIEAIRKFRDPEWEPTPQAQQLEEQEARQEQ